MIGKSPRLTDALSSVLYSNISGFSTKAAVSCHHDMLETEEKCQIHKSEAYIAVDEDSNEFACNKCVYEKRIMKPLFIATFARNLKKKFDDMYSKLLLNITLTEDFTVANITSKI